MHSTPRRYRLPQMASGYHRPSGSSGGARPRRYFSDPSVGPDGFRTKRSLDYYSLQYFEFPNKNQCEGQFILKYSSELFFGIWYSSTLLLKIGSVFSLGQYCHCWIRKHTKNPIRNSCICQKINLRLQRWESIKF